MRRFKQYVFVALSLSAHALTAHAQTTGLADTRPVKPVMMLLVDTSGSMEHKPDVGGTSPCIDCDPVCSDNPVLDANQKNRWAITLEALTGTFTSFRCKRVARSTYVGAYDQDYFLPHFDFTTSVPGTDGVLDAYAKRLKFGLMTFDGVNTTINGETLVPHANYASVKAQVLGKAGMYSYPDSVASVSATTDTPVNQYGWKPLSFPKCNAVYGINTGARREQADPLVLEPGALEPVVATETTLDLIAKKDKIKQSLLAIRPYGGTPIAGMLDDFRYYLNNDPSVKQGSDKFYACRKRFAILLTDGAPDTLFRNDPRFRCEVKDETCANKICQCPYDTEENLAKNLRQLDRLDRLWVVAFNVNDTVALAALDKIAQAGGDVDAFRALNAAQLRSKLDKLMSIAQPEATSRSVPVVIDTGRAVQLGGSQFEISAGFRVGETEDDPWEGFLYRRRIECSGASATTQDLDETKGDLFHVTLNKRAGTDRKIQSVMPADAAKNGSLFRVASATTNVPVASKINVIKANGSSFVGVAEVDPDLASQAQATEQGKTGYALALKNFDTTTATDPVYFKDADKNGTNGTVADRNRIHDYLRGISSDRVGRKLGDIYHSNPTVLPPLKPGSDDLAAYDPQLRSFYKQLLNESGVAAPAGQYSATEGRPGVVFVGSNDGILHAFNMDTWKDKAGTTYGAGHEFWGFVPPALFSKLGAAATPTHQTMFDGTPVVKDMVVDSASSSFSMKTILLSAVRGAPAFVALDVTYPEQPVFLWQRSFAYVGDTVGTPALAQLRLKWNGVVQVRAVAILPGGSGAATTSPALACNVDDLTGRGRLASGRDKVPCWKLRGRSLYVVDVATGELIQEFDSRHFPSPMTGSVAVDGIGTAISHAAYLADEDGVLWRLSMYGTEPSSWRAAPIWDLYAGNAIDRGGNTVQADIPTKLWSAGRVAYNAPLLSRNPATGNFTIVVGTGDLDALGDSAAHRVVSLEEARTLDTGTNKELTSGGITANWALQLDARESVTGPIVQLENALYFTTFTGPAGGSGNSCELGTTRIWGAHVRDKDGALPKAMMMPENGKPPLVLSYMPSTLPNSALLGLSISRDPVCVAGYDKTDPLNAGGTRATKTGSTSGSSFQVRSMVAGSGGAVIPGSDGTSSGQRQFTRTLQLPSLARSVGWASSIE
jgi:type IV pilus assembly protein PilY1